MNKVTTLRVAAYNELQSKLVAACFIAIESLAVAESGTVALLNVALPIPKTNPPRPARQFPRPWNDTKWS